MPGDCGEGLHLQATTNSVAVGNDVSDNAGGILVSDDMAASHGNVVAYNKVLHNAPDCGITVPAHNPAGGVYDNTIAANWVAGNGEGGVLIAAGVPGSAAHDNRVINNVAGPQRVRRRHTARSRAGSEPRQQRDRGQPDPDRTTWAATTTRRCSTRRGC